MAQSSSVGAFYVPRQSFLDVVAQALVGRTILATLGRRLDVRHATERSIAR